MRFLILSAVLLCASISPASAQGKPQPRPDRSPLADLTSEQKAAEIKRAIERGQARQKAVEERNSRIWKRWDYADCVGCGPMPKNWRIVYTTPARRLAGFIAADDDDAQRKGHLPWAAEAI